MIGIEYDFQVDALRKSLLFEHKQFTGVAGKNTIRLLPSLAVGVDEADQFLEALFLNTKGQKTHGEHREKLTSN